MICMWMCLNKFWELWRGCLLSSYKLIMTLYVMLQVKDRYASGDQIGHVFKQNQTLCKIFGGIKLKHTSFINHKFKCYEIKCV